MEEDDTLQRAVNICKLNADRSSFHKSLLQYYARKGTLTKAQIAAVLIPNYEGSSARKGKPDWRYTDDVERDWQDGDDE